MDAAIAGAESVIKHQQETVGAYFLVRIPNQTSNIRVAGILVSPV